MATAVSSVLAPGGRVSLSRLLPPARLLWILLAVIGAYGTSVLHGLGMSSLVLLPAVAVGVDLALQSVRFSRPRFPDPALVTGLFVALILPPTVDLVLASSAISAAIILRHAVRFRGRPWLNPAVSGVVLAGLLFGLAPAWWVAVGSYGQWLVIAFGLAVLARTPRSWRLPLGFLLAYALVTGAVHLVLGAAVDPRVLWLEVIDPTTLFFGLFMVTEPRTSPADPALQALYGAGVGVGAAVLPLAFPSLGLLLALLAVNAGMVVVRAARAWSDRPPTPSRNRLPRRRRAGAPETRWPLTYRISAGIFAVVVLVAATALTPPVDHPQPILVSQPGGEVTPPSNCAQDNPSISSGTLSTLHQALGPSVILSYNANSGLTVFYDPVNDVTVTESDLFEDYGYAEFNGDDYAVTGCHP